MIIDVILDVKEAEETGEPYSARRFYGDIMDWVGLNPAPALDITVAMDYGTNADVCAALCRYIDRGGSGSAPATGSLSDRKSKIRTVLILRKEV